MDTSKILQIVGISLQLITGCLFLLERLDIKLDEFVIRKSEEMKKYIENPKIATVIILLTILCMVILFFFISSKLEGKSLFDIEPLNLIIGIIIAFLMASGLYVLSFEATLRIAKKTGINEILSKGPQSVKFIRRNIFLFIISALIALVFLVIFNLTKQVALIYFIPALLFIAFALVAIFSLSLSIVFAIGLAVTNYFGKPKRFWIILFTMWFIGGICLLCSAFMSA